MIQFKGFERIVASDVLTEDRIESLMSNEVTSVVFGKIPETQISAEGLANYLAQKYPSSLIEFGLNEADQKEIMIVDSLNQSTICAVKYHEFGIPGSFVEFTLQ